MINKTNIFPPPQITQEQHQRSLALHGSQKLVRATKWLLYQKAMATSLCIAGTMVMSLAQSPGKIYIYS